VKDQSVRSRLLRTHHLNVSLTLSRDDESAYELLFTFDIHLFAVQRLRLSRGRRSRILDSGGM